MDPLCIFTKVPRGGSEHATWGESGGQREVELPWVQVAFGHAEL